MACKRKNKNAYKAPGGGANESNMLEDIRIGRGKNIV